MAKRRKDGRPHLSKKKCVQICEEFAAFQEEKIITHDQLVSFAKKYADTDLDAVGDRANRVCYINIMRAAYHMPPADFDKFMAALSDQSNPDHTALANATDNIHRGESGADLVPDDRLSLETLRVCAKYAKSILSGMAEHVEYRGTDADYMDLVLLKREIADSNPPAGSLLQRAALALSKVALRLDPMED